MLRASARSAHRQGFVMRIDSATTRIHQVRSRRAHLAAQGLQTYALPPAQFERFLHGEIERWNSVIKTARIAVD